MNYIKLEIAIPEEMQEIFISEFYERDFTGFEQHDDRMIAYIPVDRLTDSLREHIQFWLRSQRKACSILSETIEEPRNYNEEWEKTIRPFQVGEYYIRPSWAVDEVPDNDILLEIDPKMAFGTGYHETTKLMLRNLSSYIGKDIHVLDVGTGTGILSIAAIKRGAATAVGIDVDDWSYINALENSVLNGVDDRFEVRHGSFDVVNNRDKFDLILANVNRNALLEMAKQINTHLSKGGVLLLSGILTDESEHILKNKWYRSLTRVGEDREGEWLMLAFMK